MATVTGVNAERMIELAMGWEQVAEDYSHLDGKTSGIDARLGTAELIIQNILNNVVPGLQTDLDGIDNDLDDLSDIVVPNLQQDLLDAQALIDEALSATSDLSTQLENLNADTLPGLNELLETTFDESWDEVFSTVFPIDGTKIQNDAITAPKIFADSIISDKVATDALIARHILAGEIQTNHMAANSINGDRILANTLHADKIISNTITSNKLLVQGENLVNDPGFESGGLTNHAIGVGNWVAANVATGARTGSRCLQYTLTGDAGSSTMLTTGGDISTAPGGTSPATYHPKVSPGDIVRCGFWVRANSGSNFQARVRTSVRRIADPGVELATTTSTYVAVGHASDWTFVWAEVTVPNNTDPNMYVVAQLQGTLGSSSDTVLVDDAIMRLRFDGQLIVDGTIATQHMAAGSISGDRIATNSLHADRIISNTIEAGKLAATLVMTSRVISGGDIVGAKFKTAQNGTRMEISDDDEAGSIKGKFDDVDSLAPILINPKIIGSAGAKRQVLYLSSGAMGGGVARIELQSGSVDDTTWMPRVILDAGRVDVLSVQRNHGNIRVQEGNTLVYEAYVGGGVTGASVNNAGAFIRTGSSRKLKEDITPLTLDDALIALDMEPVSFRWKPEQKMGDRVQAGFIAEQVAQVGAHLWLTTDAEGRPSGVRYAELTAALVKIAQDQQHRISRLERAIRKLLETSK